MTNNLQSFSYQRSPSIDMAGIASTIADLSTVRSFSLLELAKARVLSYKLDTTGYQSWPSSSRRLGGIEESRGHLCHHQCSPGGDERGQNRFDQRRVASFGLSAMWRKDYNCDEQPARWRGSHLECWMLQWFAFLFQGVSLRGDV